MKIKRAGLLADCCRIRPTLDLSPLRVQTTWISKWSFGTARFSHLERQYSTLTFFFCSTLVVFLQDSETVSDQEAIRKLSSAMCLVWSHCKKLSIGSLTWWMSIQSCWWGGGTMWIKVKTGRSSWSAPETRLAGTLDQSRPYLSKRSPPLFPDKDPYL